jgi:copper transporter 1
MLYDWYTIDACFISSHWHIASSGMFARTYIGVTLLVMHLEFLRRTAKEYNRHILRQFQRSLIPCPTETKSCSSPPNNPKNVFSARRVQFRPNLFQQVARVTLHMLYFTVVYFIILLAMYYNGYIITCTIIGAWLGGSCLVRRRLV